MRQIVHDPRGEELAQGDPTESRMSTGPIERVVGANQLTQLRETRAAQRLELVEQLGNAPFTVRRVSAPVERFERDRLAVLQEAPDPRDPVGPLAVDQMRDD